MSKDKLDKLKALIRPVAREYGVSTMYLFGSYAREEEGKDSDYDFYVNDSKLTGLQIIKFEMALEKVLGRAVDVVTQGVHSERLMNAIRRDGVLVYES